MTCGAGNEKSTSIAKPSRLKSSNYLTFERPKTPLISCIKPIDQVLLIVSGTAKAFGVT